MSSSLVPFHLTSAGLRLLKSQGSQYHMHEYHLLCIGLPHRGQG